MFSKLRAQESEEHIEIIGRVSGREPEGSRRDDHALSGSEHYSDDIIYIGDEYEFTGIEDFRRYSWTRILFLIILLGVVIFISVLVGLATKNKNKGSPSSGNNNNGESVFEIKDPPSNLDDLCSPSNLQAQGGYSDCYHACATSQCCEVVESNPFSCFDDHPAVCKIYHTSCQHLMKKKAENIAAPGDNTVDEACSTKSLKSASGVQKCKSKCTGYMCCFPDSRQNYAPCSISQATCSEYGACSALLYIDADGFDSHQDIVDTVDEVCMDLGKYDNALKCSNLCRPARCCFDGQFPGQFSNNENDACSHVHCDHYEACARLYGPLKITGNTGNGEDDGFADEEDFVITADEEKVVSDLAEACSPDSILTIEGVKTCLSLCQHHFCCFAIDQSENCSQDLEDGECQLYEPCRILLDDNEKPIGEIEEICSQEHIVSHGTNDCINVCASHLCCLIDDRFESSCFIDGEGGGVNNGCDDEYSACAIFMPDKPVPIEDDKLLEAIDNHCTDDNIKVLAGKQNCEFYCMFRGCCVAEGAGNCQNTDPEFCFEVKDCNKLFQPIAVSNDVVSSQVTEICSRRSISSLAGFHKCYDECYYNLCCFLPSFSVEYELNCRDLNPETCEDYSACSILLESTVASASALEVDNACLSLNIDTVSGFEQCHSLCASHLCCSQDADAPSSCLGLLGFAECDEYTSCQFLTATVNHPEPANSNDPYIVSMVQSSCTEQNIASVSGRETCRRSCEKRACCFYPGDKECSTTNPDWCQPMAPCLSIFGDCKIASCCFEASDQGGCYEQKETWCNGYADCSVVFGTELNPSS